MADNKNNNDDGFTDVMMALSRAFGGQEALIGNENNIDLPPKPRKSSKKKSKKKTPEKI